MYIHGFLPHEIWREFTTGQVVRAMYLQEALVWGCNTDTEMMKVVNKIAEEAGAPQYFGRGGRYFGNPRYPKLCRVRCFSCNGA
jgi:hypothetical protein